MDDGHGAACPETIKEIMCGLRRRLKLKGGEAIGKNQKYDHLKRSRMQCEDDSARIFSNDRYLKDCITLLGVESAKSVPTPGVASHRAAMYDSPELDEAAASRCRSCVGSLLFP